MTCGIESHHFSVNLSQIHASRCWESRRSKSAARSPVFVMSAVSLKTGPYGVNSATALFVLSARRPMRTAVPPCSRTILAMSYRRGHCF